MAPKAAAPPPEEVVEAEDPFEVQEIVCGLVDELVDGAFTAVDEKALHAAVVPYTLNSIDEQIRKTLGMFFIDYDIGEPEGAANWTEGEEPEPCPIDSWSRGSILQKAPPPPTPAPAPAESGVPPKSPRVRTPGAAPSTAAPPTAQSTGGKPEVLIAKPPPGYEPPKVKKSAPIVTAAEKKAKRLAAEAREEVERLERLKADLKGRDYTYDSRGNIIVMEPMHPDRLPPFQQQPRLGLAMEKANKAKGKKGAGGARGAGRIDFGNNTTFKELDSLQPPVTETMAVERGVLLRQGEATKGGEPREFEGDRISRATFQELANSTGGFSARRPVAGTADAAASARDATAPVEVPPTPAKPPASSFGEAASPALRPPSMPTSPTPGDAHGMRNPSTRQRGGMPSQQKLPPPSLGATTGHGQALPYTGLPPLPEGSKASAPGSAIKPSRNASALLG